MQKKVAKKKVVAVEQVAVPEVLVAEATPAVKESKGPLKAKLRPNLYVVLFTIAEGEGYRCSTFSSKEQWKTYLAAPAQKNHPKPLTEKWFLIDMLNGTVTEQK